MYDRWSLEVFYKDANDPQIPKDISALEELYGKYDAALSSANYNDTVSSLVALMDIKERISDLSNRLYVFFRLRRSGMGVDSEGEGYRTEIQKIMTAGTKYDTRFKTFVGGIEDLDAVTAKDSLLSEYDYYLKSIKEELSHCLTEEAEDVFSRMNVSGGSAWSEQYSYLMSHTEADFMGGKKTMNALQAMFKSGDGEMRKAAYEAQLATYPQIVDSLAYSVNNIKAQVITEAELRGYASPLDMTLASYKMKRETLDAMWSAVKWAFPKFREYISHKAKLLGYEKGLPWYEMYAPIGKASAKEYTPEDAHKYLTEHFKGFSEDMSSMMDRAFKEEWIDFYSRPGKSGGAFCYNLTWFGEARILTNFNGNFSAVNTLAHELGHAFHGQQTMKNRPLNRLNPLPVSETASTFNEVFLMKNAVANAEGEDKLALLDKQITDCIMCLPDMYTRFKSEDEIFARRAKRFVYADEIKEIMTDAQKEVYGDALDNDLLYPYVWCDKSHYYSAGRSYYNFPYTFGCLFAWGLYAKFEEEGRGFVPKYREMLRTTPLKTVEEAALVAGIDITEPDFWKKSIQAICDIIDTFIKETSEVK